jgi:hypothetical protein
LCAESQVSQFLRIQSAPLADWKVADANGADARADQFEHLAANGFEHAAHLPVASFCDRHFEKGVTGAVAQAGHNRRAGRTIAQFHPIAQESELLVRQEIAGLELVGLGDLVLGIGESLGEIVVVGHDEQAAGIQVQPPDRREPRLGLSDQLVDSGPTLRIAPGSQVPFRLI